MNHDINIANVVDELPKSKSLEEEINNVKTKLLQEFETITKSLNDIESKIKDDTKTVEQQPIKQDIKKEENKEDNKEEILNNLDNYNECIDCKELIIKTIVNFFEKFLRFFINIFSHLLQVLPIFFLFYRITTFISPTKSIKTIVV